MLIAKGDQNPARLAHTTMYSLILGVKWLKGGGGGGGGGVAATSRSLSCFSAVSSFLFFPTASPPPAPALTSRRGESRDIRVRVGV